MVGVVWREGVGIYSGEGGVITVMGKRGGGGGGGGGAHENNGERGGGARGNCAAKGCLTWRLPRG